MATENPREHRREARSDDSGRYALCDLPEHRSLTIWIGSDDFEIETTAIQFVSDEVEILNRGGLRSFAAPERVWRLDLQLQEKSNPSGH